MPPLRRPSGQLQDAAARRCKWRKPGSSLTIATIFLSAISRAVELAAPPPCRPARTSATAAAESLGLVLLRAAPRTGCRRSTSGFSGVSSSPGPRPRCWCSSGAFAVSRPWRTRETPPRAAAERGEPHAGQGCDAGTGRADPPSFRRDLVSAEGASLDRSPAGRLDLCAVRRDERGIPVLRLLELWLGCRTSIAFEIVVSSGLVWLVDVTTRVSELL